LKSAKEIVAEAWHITILHRSKLFRLGFAPAFFSILVTAWYLFYQVQSFRYSPLFSDGGGDFLFSFLTETWHIINTSNVILILFVGFLIIILLGWFFAPLLCRAAIVHLVARSKTGGEMRRGMMSALLHFFVLFEMAALKHVMEPISFFTEFSFVARHIPNAISFITPILVFFAVLGMSALFLLSYTNQAIMIREESFIGAITCSARMVLENLGKTFKILILFLLVELRVVMNIFVILALPIIFASITGIFAYLFSDQIGIILAVIILVALIFLAAYISGILFVFSETIWTVAFLELYERTFEKPLLEKEEEIPELEPVSEEK